MHGSTTACITAASGVVGADMGRKIGEYTVQNHLSPVR